MGAVVAMIVCFSLLRPGAERLKARIAGSLSLALGRSVEVGRVHVQFFPRPGFELNDLRVYDDPAFGGEPLLRAADVTALIRLRSLLHGRLELARLELSEPSLNLVRSADGRWNVQPLLERSARTPLAPTSGPAPADRPAFPYIEASGARINFKIGLEKKPYALTNADFAFWQESDNSWGMRLKADPTRTDLSLGDAGGLVVSGTWQRAASLGDTPVKFNARWVGAQLGQLTRLFTGRDQGWRGNAGIQTSVVGTPADLVITMDASVDNFRRYDISNATNLQLSAHCGGRYNFASHAVRDGKCTSPAGGGAIEIHGESDGTSSEWSGTITAVSAARIVELARRVKKNLPDDLAATGLLNAEFSYQKAEQGVRIEGKGEIQDFRLTSIANRADYSLGNFPFVLTSGANTGKHGASRERQVPGGLFLESSAEPRVEFGPISLPLGGRVPATLKGKITEQTYSVAFQGECAVARALRLARILGLPSPRTEILGTAEATIEVGGSWHGPQIASGFEPALVTGTVDLHQIQFAWAGRSPIEISAAELVLAPDRARLNRLEATAAGTHWTGTLDAPRQCIPNCPVHFDLVAGEIDPGRIQNWIAPTTEKRAWYAWLGQNTGGKEQAANLHASGSIRAKRVVWHQWVAGDASAQVELGDRRLILVGLQGSIFGGQHQGTWKADFSGKPFVIEGKGKFAAIRLGEFGGVPGAVPHDSGLSGTGNVVYAVKASGSGPAGAVYPLTGEAMLSGRGVRPQRYAIGGTLAEPKVILSEPSTGRD